MEKYHGLAGTPFIMQLFEVVGIARAHNGLYRLQCRLYKCTVFFEKKSQNHGSVHIRNENERKQNVISSGSVAAHNLQSEMKKKIPHFLTVFDTAMMPKGNPNK